MFLKTFRGRKTSGEVQTRAEVVVRDQSDLYNGLWSPQHDTGRLWASHRPLSAVVPLQRLTLQGKHYFFLSLKWLPFWHSKTSSHSTGNNHFLESKFHCSSRCVFLGSYKLVMKQPFSFYAKMDFCCYGYADFELIINIICRAGEIIK